MIPKSDSEKDSTAPEINVSFFSQIFWQLTTTQLQVVASAIGLRSCGGNSLIDYLNVVGGNQVKIRQAADLCVGIRIILFKKTA